MKFTVHSSISHFTVMAFRAAAGAVIISTALCTGASAREFHVAPGGGNNLKLREPLRTIQAAVDQAQPGDTIILHPGIYRETVTLSRSGTQEKPISIRAADGEKALISGCDRITGWHLHDEAKKIWRAPMEWTLGKGRNQVFVNGAVMTEARYPDEPDDGLGMYVSGLSSLWPTFTALSIPEPVKAPGRITGKALEGFPTNHWQGACYYGVHYQGWCAQTGIIQSSEPGEITVDDRTQTWWFGPAYGGKYKPEEGRGMIVGHMNALNRPGEWHWENDTLYLIPPAGINPEEAVIEAKRRQLAFELSGQSHIRLDGLAIKAASLRLDGSSHCVIADCDLSFISHFTHHYSMGQIEKGRNTIRSGETGVFIGGHDNSFLGCNVRFSAGAGFHLRGYHHTVHNCLIDEVNYCSHYLNAITDAVTDFNDYEHFLVGGHVITYNTMRNAGRHFFNFYGNGCSRVSRDRGPMDYMATLFAHNHLYNGMLQTRDAGFLTGYYCSGGTLNDLNSQVCYNVMHDCYDIFGMRINVLGIVYLDAGTCDVDLYNNLLWAAPGSHQRGLWFNTMCVDVKEHNNVFHPFFTRRSNELRSGDFPGSKPFRFGHDHEHPPPLPHWPQLESEHLAVDAAELKDGHCVSLGNVDFSRGWQSAVMSFAGDSGGMNTDRTNRSSPRHQKAGDPLVLEVIDRNDASPGIKERWTFIHSITNGAWIRFDRVPLGDGYRRFRSVYGSTSDTPGWMEIHMDRIDGPVISRVRLPHTDKVRGGNVQVYSEVTATVTEEAGGTRDLFLVFRSEGDGAVGEFEYFRFEQYRGSAALAKNEVVFELRIDTPDGPKIGELYPRHTGGKDCFRDMVTSIEPTTGEHPLFLRVRSTIESSAGRIRALTLQRAVDTIDWSGIGEPPRRSWYGRRVLPEPANLPCARPDDVYAATRNYTDAGVIAAMKLPALKSPLKIEGVKLWFDADDSATVMKDESDKVLLWRDKSGGGLHAGQSIPAHRPLFEKGGLNGRAALRFSEERSTRLELPDISSNRTTVTVFAVISNPVPGAERNHNARILTASNGSEYDYISGIALTVPGMETGGPRLKTGVFRDRWAGRVRIGCFSPNYQTFFTGCISEIIVYDRQLTPQEQLRIKAYLTRKWGL